MARVGEKRERKKKSRKAEWSECLLEQARWPPTRLEFPSEVIWFLDSCQDLPSAAAANARQDRVSGGAESPLKYTNTVAVFSNLFDLV